MNIGFDAKRAYHNTTGLGAYSRSLVQALSIYHPEHQYYLFNPKSSSRFSLKENNIHEVLPRAAFDKLFPAAWRSSWVKKDLQRLHIDLYHGLSHEIPVGIDKTGISSVVTIHDLIHERYPQQYNPIDVKIYTRKFRYACEHASHVIAISEQTKKDIISFYNTPEEKITVCYQSCNTAFGNMLSEEELQQVKIKYALPDRFYLSVGSIIERKNLLGICKAMLLLKNEQHVPLVVIGNGGKYKQQVKEYVKQNDLEKSIFFLSDTDAASFPGYQSASDFPAIYQLASALIYPSFFEGFGIPVLEALWSRLPVITSKSSCLPEAGGDGAYYIDPASAEEMAAAMRMIFADALQTATLVEKGWQHAQQFTAEKCAASVMNVYKSLW